MIEATTDAIARVIKERAIDIDLRGSNLRVVYSCKTKNGEDEFIAEPFGNVEFPIGTKEVRVSTVHNPTNQNIYTEFYKIIK